MIVVCLRAICSSVEPSGGCIRVGSRAPEGCETVGGPGDDVDCGADREVVRAELSRANRLPCGDGDSGIEAKGFGADGREEGQGFDLGCSDGACCRGYRGR